jgi:hypothetical protein
MKISNQELLRQYMAGETLLSLSRLYRVRQTTISEALSSMPEYRKELRDRRKAYQRARHWPKHRIERVVDLYSGGLPLGRVAKEVGASTRNVLRILREADVRIRTQGESQSGQYNPCWKGGRNIDKDGYVRIYAPWHPSRAGKRGKHVLEHRLVMEGVIGRFLLQKEVVHHIDKNKQNNAPENLALYASNAEHLADELAGQIQKWTEDGLARLIAGNQKSVATRRNRAMLKNDARALQKRNAPKKKKPSQ